MVDKIEVAFNIDKKKAKEIIMIMMKTVLEFQDTKNTCLAFEQRIRHLTEKERAFAWTILGMEIVISAIKSDPILRLKI